MSVNLDPIKLSTFIHITPVKLQKNFKNCWKCAKKQVDFCIDYESILLFLLFGNK